MAWEEWATLEDIIRSNSALEPSLEPKGKADDEKLVDPIACEMHQVAA
jgi:hypothetical protein